MRNRSHTVSSTPGRFLYCLALSGVVLFASQVSGQPDEASETPPQSAASPAQGAQHTPDTPEQEAEKVARLHSLLKTYYLELQESALIVPNADELSRQEIARQDAEALNNIPFSASKVRLNGADASTALAEITQRLLDPGLPESPRDIAPISLVKTRLFDTLVASESRSLMPIGKNHYVVKVRLQPGATTIRILSHQWDMQLPQHAAAREYLITLYSPTDGTPELHVFAVEDLLAAEQPQLPAWLPAELDIKTTAQ